MATTTFVFYFFSLCLLLSVSPSFSASNAFPKTGFISLPVNIEPTTHQYYISMGVGTPRHNFNFAIDLSAKFIWYDCDKHYESTSYSPVYCRFPKCLPAIGVCLSCDGIRKIGCMNLTCGVEITNPFTYGQALGSFMGQDFLFIKETRLPRTFVSICTDSDSIQDADLRNLVFVGLNKTIKGIMGLGRSTTTQFALPYQISSSFNVPPKFTLCLPSEANKNGQLLIGTTPSSSVSLSQVGLASFNEEEYFFNVSSVIIDDKPVEFETSHLSPDKRGRGGTQISTTSLYGSLQHSMYIPFVRYFVEAAKARNITRVTKVEPFGACFDANTIADREAVPSINLVIDGRFGNVNYNISGHNSLVEVKKGVLCLAFVDAGKFATSGITLGALQLEDRILEFDLSTSILSFSSSLRLQNKSCSDTFSL